MTWFVPILKTLVRCTSATDIPFARDDANRFLPWIIGFMMCLATLVLALCLSLSASLLRWNSDTINRFTIQIPASGTVYTQRMIALLQGEKGIESAEELSKSDMRRLISPWLGDGADALDMLPLPTLIEVKVRDNATPDMPRIATHVHNLAPQATIDDYKLWMAKFQSFVRLASWVAGIFALLILAVCLGIVLISARTALHLHHETVHLLYTIGAEDRYIARQFQANALYLVGKSALYGAGIAAILFAVLGRMGSGIDAPLLPDLHFSFTHISLFLLLPLGAALASMTSTRYAVLSLLKQQP